MATNTFVVGGKLFVLSPDTDVGVQLDDLERGDDLVVIYNTADAEEPIQVIALSKIN